MKVEQLFFSLDKQKKIYHSLCKFCKIRLNFAKDYQTSGMDKKMGKMLHRSSNNVRSLREEMMISKAELARKADLSIPTIDRVEKGYPCRMDTKRKIIIALGLSLNERERVFTD